MSITVTVEVRRERIAIAIPSKDMMRIPAESRECCRVSVQR
jgi:hypothetical protein